MYSSNYPPPKKRDIANPATLPVHIDDAKNELCRLHVLKQPLKDQIDEIEEEMKLHKDTIKEYCAQQQNKCPDILDISRHLKVQCYAIKKQVKGPTVSEVQQITSEVLNDLQDNAATLLKSKMIECCDQIGLTDSQKDLLLGVVAENLALSAIAAVRSIQHRISPPPKMISASAAAHEELKDQGASRSSIDASLYTYVVKVIGFDPEEGAMEDASSRKSRKL